MGREWLCMLGYGYEFEILSKSDLSIAIHSPKKDVGMYTTKYIQMSLIFVEDSIGCFDQTSYWECTLLGFTSSSTIYQTF